MAGKDVSSLDTNVRSGGTTSAASAGPGRAAMTWRVLIVFMAILSTTLTVAACSSGLSPSPTPHQAPGSTIPVSPTMTVAPPVTGSFAFNYPNAAGLGAGLSGKVEARFTTPVYTIGRDGTVDMTYHLAIENKTRQTMTGYVLRIVVRDRAGTIVLTSRESVPRGSERISIMPGAYAEDGLRSRTIVGTGGTATDDTKAKMTAEMYVESIAWEDGDMVP
jgi:hypothetical protein